MRTAILIASEMRRTARRRQTYETEQAYASSVAPDEALEQRQALARLDSIIAQMEEPLRAIFLLYEIEEMTMSDIALALALPAGTVASRLRRAREQFQILCARSEK